MFVFWFFKMPTKTPQFTDITHAFCFEKSNKIQTPCAQSTWQKKIMSIKWPLVIKFINSRHNWILNVLREFALFENYCTFLSVNVRLFYTFFLIKKLWHLREITVTSNRISRRCFDFIVSLGFKAATTTTTKQSTSSSLRLFINWHQWFFSALSNEQSEKRN